MEILNVRQLADGYLVNGLITVLPTDTDYQQLEAWVADGKEVMPQYTDAELLEQAKAIKSTQIENDFALAESQTVEVNLITYSGGNDSVITIDSYVRLNRLAGATTHDIWDVNGTETSLSDADADSVILAIGSQASLNKFTKKNRKVALALATTITEVEAI